MGVFTASGTGAVNESLTFEISADVRRINLDLGETAGGEAGDFEAAVTTNGGFVSPVYSESLAGKGQASFQPSCPLLFVRGSRLDFTFDNPENLSWTLTVTFEETQTFITIWDLKRELGLDNPEEAQCARMAGLAAAVQDLWAGKTQRNWAVGSYSEIYSNPLGTAQRLFCRHYPVISLTAVKVDHNREFIDPGGVVPSDRYDVDAATGIIHLMEPLPKGLRHIQISYTAGYADDELPESIRHILTRQAAHWYKQGRDGLWLTRGMTQPGGGTITFSHDRLAYGLLPEFEDAAGRNGRPGL